MNFKSYLALIKPGICFWSVMMVALGFLFATKTHFSAPTFLMTLIGASLVGFSCGALNQLLEIDTDKLMARTQTRPLPSGALTPKQALKFGFWTGLSGIFWLILFVNPLSGVLGAFTLLFYLTIYTPAKKISCLSTLLGAIPGALPILIGYASGAGFISKFAYLLFFILFIWQIPHFLAIAFLYEKQYRASKLPVLPSLYPKKYVALQILLYTFALVILTLVPGQMGLLGGLYFWGIFCIGVLFVSLSLWHLKAQSLSSARAIFFMSLLYLPFIGVVGLLDKLWS